MESIIIAAAAAFGLPTAVTGFLFWWLKRSIDKRDKRAEEREKNREELDLYQIKSNAATMALAEATARAVQRIPDAHCNGDMHRALEYADKVKQERREFLNRMGVHALHED